jgi:hypothetical protein
MLRVQAATALDIVVQQIVQMVDLIGNQTLVVPFPLLRPAELLDMDLIKMAIMDIMEDMQEIANF